LVFFNLLKPDFRTSMTAQEIASLLLFDRFIVLEEGGGD